MRASDRTTLGGMRRILQFGCASCLQELSCQKPACTSKHPCGTLVPVQLRRTPTGKQVGSFSRDCGRSSMVDQALAGRQAGFLGLGLLANSVLKRPELALGQGNQERFE